MRDTEGAISIKKCKISKFKQFIINLLATLLWKYLKQNEICYFLVFLSIFRIYNATQARFKRSLIALPSE